MAIEQGNAAVLERTGDSNMHLVEDDEEDDDVQLAFNPGEPRDGRGRWTKANRMWGWGLDKWLKIGPTNMPFPVDYYQNDPWDKEAVLEQTKPSTRRFEDFDPRTLIATQGGITIPGVKHYAKDRPGLYAQNDPNNADPVVYVDDNGPRILTGHHRAVAALLKGEPFRAIRVKAPAHVDLSNPSLRRTRLAAAQLLDGHDVVDLLRRRNFSTPVSQAVKMLVEHGTKTRPNARLYGHRLTLPIRVERDREALYRSAYVLKAAERLQAAVDDGVPLVKALANEQRYHDLHEIARSGRLNAVTEAQRAGMWFGQEVKVNGATRHLLGWYLNPAIGNGPECIAAAGNNFYAEEGTVLGYPGGVHPNCGCYAGEPHANAGLVNDALSGVVRLGHARKPAYTLTSRKVKSA